MIKDLILTVLIIALGFTAISLISARHDLQKAMVKLEAYDK